MQICIICQVALLIIIASENLHLRDDTTAHFNYDSERRVILVLIVRRSPVMNEAQPTAILRPAQLNAEPKYAPRSAP
jgi:hypothetical protein